MTARNRRHDVVERWRDGGTFYDVTRRSWEEPRDVVTLRAFLTRHEADRWVARIEARQDVLWRAVQSEC